MSLPKELMGISQLRMGMAWQKVKSVDEVKPSRKIEVSDGEPTVVIAVMRPEKNATNTRTVI